MTLNDRPHVAELIGIVIEILNYLHRLGYADGLIISIILVIVKFRFFFINQYLTTIRSAFNDFYNSLLVFVTNK